LLDLDERLVGDHEVAPVAVERHIDRQDRRVLLVKQDQLLLARLDLQVSAHRLKVSITHLRSSMQMQVQLVQTLVIST